MRQTTRRSPWQATGLTAAGVVGVVGLGGCGPADRDRADAPTTATTAAQQGAAAPVPDQDRYRDGEYTATGWYGGLPSHIVVDVTLRDDVVTDVEVTPTATNETSLDLQERFAEAVVDVVVGRPLDEIELDYLAGSSGTTLGFNDALEQIREQAAR
ncbi:hypothetical protein [Cellulomonas hominis]|uniref:hypothetical protein n=1 Tax=Cellulomonas hominis TaxID=156981 RepID=UPI001B8FF4A4|nr:hypothetical protein [Cellulomonas hominis]VTR76016.1 hypothetical protein CHMI_00772 [Cellulomonas hominis]